MRQTIKMKDSVEFDDHPVFLIGSGISTDAPSNLPTGGKFQEYLIDWLIPDEFKQKILEYCNPFLPQASGGRGFLRFEMLVGLIQKSLDKSLAILNVFGDADRPNFNHIFVAEMLGRECPVFTTNFDSLIEYAMKQFHSINAKIPVVIKDEDWEVQKQAALYKLHGSIWAISDKEKR